MSKPTKSSDVAIATAGAVLPKVGGLMTGGGMPDRIWFSCGLTINIGNYESARVDAGMATDVQPGEKLTDALARCKAFVTHEIEGQSYDIRRHLRGEDEPESSPSPKPAKKRKKSY